MNERKVIFLEKLFEKSERYHDLKENRAWIAATLYFTLNITILTIVFDKMNTFKLLFMQIPIIILVISLYVCVLFYVLFQFKMKFSAAAYYNELENNISEELGYDFLEIRKKSSRQDKYLSWKLFPIISEICVVLLLYVFFAVEFYFLSFLVFLYPQNIVVPFIILPLFLGGTLLLSIGMFRYELCNKPKVPLMKTK